MSLFCPRALYQFPPSGETCGTPSLRAGGNGWSRFAYDLQQMPYLFDQPSRQIGLVFVSLVIDLKDLYLPRGQPFKGARPGLLQRRRVKN